MNRRQFSSAALGALGAAMVPGFPRTQQQLRVDGERLNRQLIRLAGIGADRFGGVSRVAYSEEDLAGRDYVMGLMRDAGLDVTIDLAGNIVGRRSGRDSSLPPLMAGSHIDSVPEGGKFDGTVGSLGAIEVARTLAEAGVETLHPLEIIVFQNEENGSIGSRAITLGLDEELLGAVGHSGKTTREGIAFIGGNPDQLDSAIRRPGAVFAYLELHIEQSGVLESNGVQIGVVEGIVGNQRWIVTVHGSPGHAGATPMDQRQDALLAAARFIDAVHRIVTSVPGPQVATVGRIEAFPGAPNVIPGRVEFTLEMRDLDRPRIEGIFRRLQETAQGEIAASTGTKFTFDKYHDKLPARTNPRLQELVAEAADELGLSNRIMPSTAGHDAQNIAYIAPIGMLFVPSAGGISHAAGEHSSPQDITNGANVLLQGVLKADRAAIPNGPTPG